MKKYLFLITLLISALANFGQSVTTGDPYLVPVYPGKPVDKPFWNQYSMRFMYAPAFNMPEIAGAVSYRFNIEGYKNKTLSFIDEKPWANLSPIWAEIPEGYTTLKVEGLDSSGKIVGKSGEKIFYRSPGFSGEAGNPVIPYIESANKGLKAIFEAPHTQYWLSNHKPDPSYRLYCYPNKVIGGLIRAMSAYAKQAVTQQDRVSALKIARAAADYLLSERSSESSRYAHVPPTYLVNVDKPYPQAIKRTQDKWLMVPSAIDAAFGFLDAYDATSDVKYMNAAMMIARTLAATQETDGTWPLMVNSETGASVHKQRLIPTWIIFFLDRLEKQYKVTDYKKQRHLAWQWIVNNPLKTYQWNGQFEDVTLHGPYENLAREQACDVALLLLENVKETPNAISQAAELLRFAEDQFVIWDEVKDPDGWRKATPKRLKTPHLWLAGSVLEQFVCYEPVARSSAILINTYLKAHQVTGNPMYLNKAKALANGLVSGQKWVQDNHGGKGEIPTWVMKRAPSNWLNNSYYAAQSILNIANYTR